MCYYENQSEGNFENGQFVRHSKNVCSCCSDNVSAIRGARLVYDEEIVSESNRFQTEVHRF